MTNQLRAALPPLPPRMASLPVDERGYPVPYFVAWVDGKPDHRVMDGGKLPNAMKFGLCWMCGQPVGAYKTFCIGPMCCLTRTISEPPSHLECVRFAAIACPFLTRPKAQRRAANMPEEAIDAAGVGLKRNPGAVCLWTVKKFQVWRDEKGGVLFNLPDAVGVEWYAEGRPALRSEVDESIRTGVPLLREHADAQDAKHVREGLRPIAVAELEMRIARETAWLDKQTWPKEST